MATVLDSRVAWLLFAAALASRFATLSYPRQVIFDEFHFGRFVNGYLTGEYFFDIHPPLGKQLLALGARLGGYDGAQQWGRIGEAIGPAVELFALRAVPALAGSLLVPLLFCAARAAGLTLPAATLAACGVLFDLCYVVESRLVVTDAILLVGIGAQLAGSFSSDHHPRLSRGWLARVALAGLGTGLAVGTKWTGAGTLAVAGAHSLLALGRGHKLGERPSRLACEAAARAALLLLLPALMYAGAFYAHFALLPRTGPGAKFMTPSFRATLAGDAVTAASLPPNATLPSFWARTVELNREMLRANAAVSRGHDWSSRWWEWPLMMRTVLYWRADAEPYLSHAAGLDHARIYCMGTPLVWWLAAAAPTLFAAWACGRALAPPDPHAEAAAPEAAPEGAPEGAPPPADAPAPPPAPRHERALGPAGPLGSGALLLVGYLANWLPFVGVDRVAFIYHFLPALLHALLLLGLVADVALPSTPLLSGRAVGEAQGVAGADAGRSADGVRWLVCGGLIGAMAACFAFFAPLGYGAPLSRAAFEGRMWSAAWR